MALGFVDALKGQAKEVIALEKEHQDQLIRLLKATRTTLRGRMLATSPDRPFDAFSMTRIMGETESLISMLEKKAMGFFSKSQEEAARLALEHIRQEGKRLGVAFDGKPTLYELEVPTLLADPKRKLLMQSYKGSIDAYGLAFANQVRSDLFVGLRTGETLEGIAKRIASPTGALAGQEDSAKRLARTEITNAYATAKNDAISEIDAATEEEGGLQKIWIKQGSYKCPICDPVHGSERPSAGKWTFTRKRKRDGKVFTWQVAHPPAHPHCLPPWALIDTPSGKKRIDQIVEGDQVLGGLTGKPRRVTATHINNFRGSLTVLLTDNLEVALTGNHPVLTGRGWIDADAVNVDDCVFEHLSIGAPFLDGLSREADDRPSSSEKIGIADSVEPLFPGRFVPFTGIDLDIDHAFWHSQIEIVGTNSKAGHHIEPMLLQHGGDDALVCSHGSFFGDSLSDAEPMQRGLSLASHGSMRSSGLLEPLLGSSVAIPLFDRIGSPAPSETCASESPVENGSAHADMLTDGFHAQSLLPMHPMDTRSVYLNPSHVRSIEQSYYAGKVFNLSVEHDQSYVADGIVVHNCVCSISGIRPSWRDKLKRLGYLDDEDIKVKRKE